MRPVLVVDDDPGTRDSFTAILKLEGIPAVTASTAEEGLAIAGQLDLGLILADLRLPKRTGIDLVTDLRARGVDTPVVIITAHATASNVVAAMRAGAADCLEKPIDDDTLLRVVRPLLRLLAHERNNDASPAARALTIIQQDLTAGALARQLAVSEPHLCRAFKALTGTTPGVAIREARASHAQSLLRFTGKSVKEVAFASASRSVNRLEKAMKLWTPIFSPGNPRNTAFQSIT